MSKKRRGVCIDDALWDFVKEAAWGRKESASKFLRRLIVDARDDLVSDLKEKHPLIEVPATEVIERNPIGGLREQYKLKHPHEMCPKCRERNRNCKCPV